MTNKDTPEDKPILPIGTIRADQRKELVKELEKRGMNLTDTGHIIPKQYIPHSEWPHYSINTAPAGVLTPTKNIEDSIDVELLNADSFDTDKYPLLKKYHNLIRKAYIQTAYWTGSTYRTAFVTVDNFLADIGRLTDSQWKLVLSRVHNSN